MKYVIILLLAKDPIHVPLDKTLGCYEQGNEVIEAISTYKGPGSDQGWYTKEGNLIFGFYCK